MILGTSGFRDGAAGASEGLSGSWEPPHLPTVSCREWVLRFLEHREAGTKHVGALGCRGVHLSCGRWVTAAGGQGVPSRHKATGWATKVHDDGCCCLVHRWWCFSLSSSITGPSLQWISGEGGNFLSPPHTNNSHRTVSKNKQSSKKSAKDLYALSPKKAWRWP